MRRLLSLLIIAGAVACGRGENSSTVDLIKTVATEARTKARVEMSVKMAGDQPASDDLALLKTLEDRVDKARIGRLVSSGTEAGFMNVVVEVDNTADAIAKLRKESQALGVLERSSFKVRD
ncbi:MAG: hypothetical protein ACXW3E_03460 [Thermoanaerobaculia bacterium]